MRGSRGFGLIHLFIFLCVFVFFLFTVSFLIHKTGLDSKEGFFSPKYTEINSNIKKSNTNNKSNYSKNNEEYDYSSIELQLKNAATVYQRDLYPDFNDKEKSMYVTSKKLIALDYLTNLTDGRVICEGYAQFSYNNVVNVKAFIKCGSNYKTKGYKSIYSK